MKNRSGPAPVSCAVVAAVLLGSFIGMPSAEGQATNATPFNQPAFEKTVRPVLAKYCFACHNEKLKTANLDLEAFQNGNQAVNEPRVWDKVLEKLATGKM